jgi:hypothetical protein
MRSAAGTTRCGASGPMSAVRSTQLSCVSERVTPRRPPVPNAIRLGSYCLTSSGRTVVIGFGSSGDSNQRLRLSSE